MIMGGRATIPTKEKFPKTTHFSWRVVDFRFPTLLRLGWFLENWARGIQPLGYFGHRFLQCLKKNRFTIHKNHHNMYLLGEGDCITYTSPPPKKGWTLKTSLCCHFVHSKSMGQNARNLYVTRSLHLFHIASQAGSVFLEFPGGDVVKKIFCLKLRKQNWLQLFHSRKSHSTKRVTGGKNMFIFCLSHFHPFSILGLYTSFASAGISHRRNYCEILASKRDARLTDIWLIDIWQSGDAISKKKRGIHPKYSNISEIFWMVAETVSQSSRSIAWFRIFFRLL